MTPIRVRLYELREARGWTQQDLSDAADVRQATISELESGKRKRIDFAVLERLAIALNVEPGDLIVREDAGRKRRRRA